MLQAENKNGAILMDTSKQREDAKSIVNTGGGTMVDGDVHPNGDFVARDQIQVIDRRFQGTKTNNYFNFSNLATPSTTHLAILGLVAIIGIIALALGNPMRSSATATLAPTAPLPATVTPLVTPTSTVIAPLQAIDFQYTDPPTAHGWKLTESQAVTYTHSPNGQYGYTLGITAAAKYALSFDVKPAARPATQVEAIVKLDKTGLFYILTELQSSQGTATQKMWFKFKAGTPAMKPVEGKNDEWQIVMEAETFDNGWQKFQIDLADVVAKTVGKEGWRLGQLKGFRVRGNLALAAITVYP